MPDLPISSLPLATTGYSDSLMVIVNYNPIATGRTESIPFSAITASTIGTSGSSGTSGTSGSAGTSGTSPVSPFPYVYGLFAQTGDSATVSGTTSETTIIGGGIGSLSVSANTFSVGDTFSCRVIGHVGSKNNDTLTIRVKSGSVILGTTGPIIMPSITNSIFFIELSFTVRSIGGVGVSSIVSGGLFTYNRDASDNFEGGEFSTLNNTTFDTTIDNTLDITAQFSSTGSENFVYSEILILNKVY